jgi:hypothetical protein
MAKAYDILEMWPGSQNLRATPKESPGQDKQKTYIGYISGTEEIIKASWSNIPLVGSAEFKLS